MSARESTECKGGGGKKIFFFPMLLLNLRFLCLREMMNSKLTFHFNSAPLPPGASKRLHTLT